MKSRIEELKELIEITEGQLVCQKLSDLDRELLEDKLANAKVELEEKKQYSDMDDLGIEY